MEKRGWMILRVLINRYNPKEEGALLKLLQDDAAEKIASQNIRSAELGPILEQPQKAIAKLHYSWIEPVFLKFPSSMLSIVASTLTREQMMGLHISNPKPVPDPVKLFILEKLSQFLEVKEHLPPEYLPQTELSSLALATLQEINQLVEFLGLYDLSSEIRHIVDRNYLKSVYTCLSSKQFQYLKMCLHQKELLAVSKMGIDPAKQDGAKIQQLMVKRGLLRLGKALCGEHPDLVWHIARVLDKERGAILQKEYKAEPIVKVTTILRQQVLHVLNFLKNG